MFTEAIGAQSAAMTALLTARIFVRHPIHISTAETLEVGLRRLRRMKESNPKLKINVVLKVVCGVAQSCGRVDLNTREIYVEFAQPEYPRYDGRS